MTSNKLRDIAINALQDLKAIDLTELDVSNMTSVTDLMIVVSGSSDRHVKSLANNLIVKTKEAGYKPLGVEGEREGEWVLVDLGEVVVHIMMRQTRDFYNLEALWNKAFANKPDQSE